MDSSKDTSQQAHGGQSRSTANNVSVEAISLPAVKATVQNESENEAPVLQQKADGPVAGAFVPQPPPEKPVTNQMDAPLQFRHTNQPSSPSINTTHSFSPVQLQENKTGMPNTLKSGIENLSGQAMDDVKVHYNSAQPKQLNALAYAQGTDIHVGPGQEKHLPHEAWHVVQQKQGRVQPTVQMRPAELAGNDALVTEPLPISNNAPVQGLFGSEEYREQYQPGMAMFGAAERSGKMGLAGVEGSAGLGLAGVKKSGELGLTGVKKSGELALEGAAMSGQLGLTGAVKSGRMAKKGVLKSAELGYGGAKGSAELALAGVKGSGSLALRGAKKSGELGLAGASKSLSLAGSGISASAKLAAAPANWAKQGMAGTKSYAKKAGYLAGGFFGSIASGAAGLVGAAGSGVLGLAGAAGSGALGLAGAAGSAGLGLAGAGASAGLGLAGAAGSAGLGLAGAGASAGLGLTGAATSAGLGLAGAGTSAGLGLAGAATSAGLGLAGAGTSAGLGLAGAGTSAGLGLTGAAVGGGLGATGMILGNMYSGGKYVKNLAKNNLNKELLGIYKPGADHSVFGDKKGVGGTAGEFNPDGTRKTYGAIGAKEGANYGLLGASGAATGGATITDMASKGSDVMGASIRDKGFTSGMAGGAQAFGTLGAISGGLGAAASVVEGAGALKEMADSSGSKTTRGIAGAQAASSFADATKASATAAFNIGGLQNAGSTVLSGVQSGAQTAAGGAGVAAGGVDMLRGAYGIRVAHKRGNALKAINEREGLSSELKNITKEGMETQSRAKTTGIGQVAKGAVSIIGGSILLAVAMASPIGWMLLGLGAAAGIIASIHNWWSKRKHKKVVVIRELGLEDQMKTYDEKVAQIEKDTGTFGRFRKDRKEQIAALPNPLTDKLAELKFTSIGHCYNGYINATANKIYQSGVVNQREEYEEIITTIGLKPERKGVDPSGWKPTPEKIAKALSG